MIRRAVTALLLALGLLTVPALPAVAAPAPAVGPVAMKACAPAPEPASPLAGLPGKLYGQPTTASDADPFGNSDVTIADVYGYSYAWVDYDNGCVPGSDAWAKAQTGIGNLLLSAGASVSAFTHGLFTLVVTPDFMAPLDDVLTSTTAAIKGGFWDPWVTAILVLVGAGVLVAAMRAKVATAVTTVGWAVLVLVGATYVMSYPVSSARAVDGLIQTTVATSAQGIGATREIYGPPSSDPNTDEARVAIDDMFDTINRDLFYTAWLDGTLGTSDSTIARTYGPDLFRASHLTWSEAETVKEDPVAGQAIVEAKKDLWVQTAAAVEREDSGAYQQLTGNNGRWDAAGTVVLRVALTMPFLAIAAVLIVVAYVATRVFVPLAPGFAVIGLLYIAQDWVITVLRQVGRLVILGPAFFVAALANLLLAAAVLDSDLAFGLKLVIVAAVPFVLFKLLRPGRAVPGAGAARRLARSGLGAILNGITTRHAVRDGIGDADQKAKDEAADSPRREPKLYRYSNPKNGPVATGETLQLPASQRPHELPPAHERAAIEGATTSVGNNARTPARDVPRRTRRELAAAGAGLGQGTTAPSARATFRRDLDDGATATGPSASPTRDGNRGGMAAVLRDHPAIHRDEHDVDLAAPADKNVTPDQLMGRAVPLPPGVIEAEPSYDANGDPVFQIWRPPIVAHAAAEGREEDR